MAGFSVFELSDGRFRAVAQIPGRKPKAIERKTRALATKAMKEWLITYGRLNPTSVQITTGDMLDAYIAKIEAKEKKGDRSDKTLEDYRRHRDHFKARIGGVPASKLTSADIEENLGIGVKQRINRRDFIRAAFNSIIKRLDPNIGNPAEFVELDSYAPKGARSLNDLEYNALLVHESNKHCYWFWRLMGEVGMGPKEGRSLTDIYLDDDGLPWAKLHRGKNSYRTQAIPLTMELFEGLQAALPFKYGETYYRDRFRETAKLAGIVNASPYSLRHYFANKYRKKVEKDVLRRLMRHADSRTTEKYYVEIESDELRAAIDPTKPNNGGSRV